MSSYELEKEILSCPRRGVFTVKDKLTLNSSSSGLETDIVSYFRFIFISSSQALGVCVE